MVRLAQAPRIAMHFALSGGEKWGGVGEPGTAPIAPAVSIAIFSPPASASAACRSWITTCRDRREAQRIFKMTTSSLVGSVVLRIAATLSAATAEARLPQPPRMKVTTFAIWLSVSSRRNCGIR